MPDLGLEVLLKGNNMLRLLQGLWAAVEISLVSIVTSFPLGIILGIIMTKENILLKFLTKIYLEFIRIMPQLVLLFIVFFGSTKILGINLPGETSAIIVFVLWGAAEMGDLTRSAILSVPVHQYESSKALGLSKTQSYFYVILPQAINLVTRMVKTTSLVLMIGVVEVLKTGQQIIEANRMTSPNAAFGVFLVIFILYFLVCWPASIAARQLEKKWS